MQVGNLILDISGLLGIIIHIESSNIRIRWCNHEDITTPYYKSAIDYLIGKSWWIHIPGSYLTKLVFNV